MKKFSKKFCFEKFFFFNFLFFYIFSYVLSKLKQCCLYFQLSIFQSIEENDLKLLTALLTEEQINLNHVYEEQKGRTLLHTAIEKENLEAVRLLVSSGAKANHALLHLAALKGLVNIYFSSKKLSGSQKAKL